MNGLNAQLQKAQMHIRFPIFRKLNITNYGLYPGNPNKRGLHLEFKEGLTLIVGTNGLGKTTLITVLYRMLSGGYELSRSALDANELGGAALEFSRLKPKQRSMFADRVNDRAKNATAVLEVDIGVTRLTITRRLDNLDLVSLFIDGKPSGLNEEGFQNEVFRLSGLSSFGDWLLFLRQMVFYFEDRRSLVWDPSAQRQAFRMLFLPPVESRELYIKERTVLKLDSQVRNDSAALYRLQQRVAQDDHKLDGAEDVRAHILAITPLLEQDREKRTELLELLNDLDEQRRSHRRDLLDVENFASRRERELEDSRLRIVYSQFPGKAETAKYLLSLLMSDGRCAVCSSENEEMAGLLNKRTSDLSCILCGAPTQKAGQENVVLADHAKLATLRADLETLRIRIKALKSDLQAASTKHDDVSSHLIRLSDEIEDREQTLESLTALLPAEEEKQSRAREELSVLREKIAEDRLRLEADSKKLSDATALLNILVQEKAEAIKAAFKKYAEGFLFETVSLKWSPRTSRIGQLQRVETASFDLDMSGTDFQQVQRRDGPGAVSESQREFIDLAFRMALIEVAGNGTGGSLIIDAPESSLDAVFVERAADVLSRFGAPDLPNRLVIASNLVEGRLLPRLIKKGVSPQDRETRLLNLMDVAVPTAAAKSEAAKYQQEWQNILEEAGLE